MKNIVPYLSGYVHVGDVVISPQFVYGHVNVPSKPENIFVGGKTQPNCVDSTRTKAKWVVISASMVTDPNGFSSWPDGWLVTARRLNSESKDDGLGEEINFYQYFTNGSSSYGIVKQVKVVGKMEQRFV